MVPHTPWGECVALLATWTPILHENKLNAGPHTHSGGSPLDAQNPTQQEHRMKNGRAQPPRTQSKNPVPEHPQATQRMKYGTTRPLRGLFFNYETPPEASTYEAQGETQAWAVTQRPRPLPLSTHNHHTPTVADYPHPHESLPDQKTNVAPAQNNAQPPNTPQVPSTPMLTTYAMRGQAQYHTPAVVVPLLAQKPPTQNMNTQLPKIMPEGPAPEHCNWHDDGQSMVPHLLWQGLRELRMWLVVQGGEVLVWVFIVEGSYHTPAPVGVWYLVLFRWWGLYELVPGFSYGGLAGAGGSAGGVSRMI
ncbi:hypothetical protein BS47DRAFT_1359824 [Hydnum rufescens UP504]|uniref:Uncharacterized protein n=1 Tax=Hydnum rufescens UP504 TaxID=1448309 RepID=A0A9P6DZI4_9AGAM|nr:hypothetical protein BS47DRAFT_1359824 [Hydnum rufescens UP504]